MHATVDGSMADKSSLQVIGFTLAALVLATLLVAGITVRNTLDQDPATRLELSRR